MPLLIQFAGSFIALAAFVATQAGWFSATSSPYLGLNVIGSTALAASAAAEAQWGFVSLESVWIAVSAVGLCRNFARFRRRPRSAPPR